MHYLSHALDTARIAEGRIFPGQLNEQSFEPSFLCCKCGVSDPETPLKAGLMLLQALTQAQHVKLTGSFTGNTPSIMAPATVSPFNPEDPGATPLGTTPGKCYIQLPKLLLNSHGTNDSALTGKILPLYWLLQAFQRKQCISSAVCKNTLLKGIYCVQGLQGKTALYLCR